LMLVFDPQFRTPNEPPQSTQGRPGQERNEYSLSNSREAEE
jgi:hypothetical protein